MKKHFKKGVACILSAGLMVFGVSFAATAYAANTETDGTEVSESADYSVEDMLENAIETEYMTQAEYSVIIDALGEVRPYSNFINAEETHINLLAALLEAYDVAIPNQDWESLVTAPETLEDAYEAGIAAEEKNVAMYEEFLAGDIPDDVKDVFTYLLTASERHVTALERQSDGTYGAYCGYGVGNQSANKNQRNSGAGRGRGMGQGYCMY